MPEVCGCRGVNEEISEISEVGTCQDFDCKALILPWRCGGFNTLPLFISIISILIWGGDKRRPYFGQKDTRVLTHSHMISVSNPKKTETQFTFFFLKSYLSIRTFNLVGGLYHKLCFL